MVERGQDLGFALEAGHALGVAGKRLGQNLQRNIALQLGVAGAVHLAHAAGTDGREDLVRAKSRTHCQRHDWNDLSAKSASAPQPDRVPSTFETLSFARGFIV